MQDDDQPPPPRGPIPDLYHRLLASFVVPTPGDFLKATPDKTQWKLNHQLLSFELAYRESKNPLWAWRAYLACYYENAPPPAWVTEYLGRVAEKLWNLSHNEFPPTEPGPALVEALEMKLTGPGTAFSRLEDTKEPELAYRMHWHIKAGQNETAAKYLVAQECEVSESTALRAWKKYQGLFGEQQTGSP